MESSRKSEEPGTDRPEDTPRSDEDAASGWSASARERVGRGFDRGKEAFGAFREALEETFTDARERGDLTTDRAKELWGRAVDRARDATSDARDRFDFASRAEFEELRSRVAALETLLGVRPPEPAADAESTEAPPAREGGEPREAATGPDEPSRDEP
jgi:hypothetical protein